jgi:Kef-type K+ transport system membrane component KefB
MEAGFTAGHSDPIAPVILGVTGILAFAVIGRLIARRIGQPTVVGELLMGILIGNVAWYLGIDLIVLLREGPQVFDLVHDTLAGAPIEEAAVAIFGAETGNELARILTGPRGGELMQVAHSVDTFSRYGVIFLLFMVGLQTDLDEMRAVSKDSARVALLGVLLPSALGFGVMWLLQPGLSLGSILFISATLAATSIGITANVLQELNVSKSREGRVILGAAVCDDILGLIMLAIVSGIVVSGSVDVSEIAMVVLMSGLFLAVVVVLGPYIIKLSVVVMRQFDFVEAKIFTSYLFVMILAWMANLAGLATIIGAFAAGVVMKDSFFQRHHRTRLGRVITIRQLITPLEVVLVPIFFVLSDWQTAQRTWRSKTCTPPVDRHRHGAAG